MCVEFLLSLAVALSLCQQDFKIFMLTNDADTFLFLSSIHLITDCKLRLLYLFTLSLNQICLHLDQFMHFHNCMLSISTGWSFNIKGDKSSVTFGTFKSTFQFHFQEDESNETSCTFYFTLFHLPHSLWQYQWTLAQKIGPLGSNGP